MGSYDDGWNRFEAPIMRFSDEAVEQIRDEQLAELDAIADLDYSTPEIKDKKAAKLIELASGEEKL